MPYKKTTSNCGVYLTPNIVRKHCGVAFGKFFGYFIIIIIILSLYDLKWITQYNLVGGSY